MWVESLKYVHQSSRCPGRAVESSEEGNETTKPRQSTEWWYTGHRWDILPYLTVGRLTVGLQPLLRCYASCHYHESLYLSDLYPEISQT